MPLIHRVLQVRRRKRTLHPLFAKANKEGAGTLRAIGISGLLWMLGVLPGVLPSVTNAGTLYKIADASGNVTYTERALSTTAGRVTVIKVSPTAGASATKPGAAAGMAPITASKTYTTGASIDAVQTGPSAPSTSGKQISSSNASGGAAGGSTGNSSLSTGSASGSSSGNTQVKQTPAVTVAAATAAATRAVSATAAAVAASVPSSPGASVSPLPSKIVVASTSPPPVAASTPPPPAAVPGALQGADFDIGVNVHNGLWGPIKQEGLFASYKYLGLTSARQTILWSWVEKQKGQLVYGPELTNMDIYIRNAKLKGVDTLLLLCYGNGFYENGGMPLTAESQEGFARYAAFVATHFKGVVKRYEVWNEWSIGMGSKGALTRGDPIAYTRLLTKVKAALKAVDPEIVVVGGVIAHFDDGWSQLLFNAGALNSMDAYSVHPYNFPDVPEKAVLFLDRLQSIAKLSTGGRELPIYVTEMGWPTHTSGVAPSVAANYLARFYLLAPMYSFIKGAWWYDYVDDGPDPNAIQQNFGLYHADYTAKAAACAMSEVSKFLADYRPVSVKSYNNGLWVAKYTNGTSYTHAVWMQDAGTSIRATVTSYWPNGAAVSVRAICRDLAVTGNGSTAIGATISNSPLLFSTMGEGLSVIE
jgi:hypothetical protein